MPTKNARTPNTLTVQELRDYLADYPDDMPVVFAYPSGDYWKTQIAGTFNDIQEGAIEYTDYHRGFKIVDDDEEGNPPEGATKALILNP